MTPAPPTRLPSVSVIVPVYNVAGYVAACIDSLRAQTLTSFEVLMIDDGSTDGSSQLALQAAGDDPRFRLIVQDNAGLSAARNTGLDAATGDFIAFVDSDDRVMPDYLMHLWQALDATGGDWVACAVQNTYRDGTGSTHSAIHGADDLAQHMILHRYPLDSWPDVVRHFPSAWNKLYRRTLIEGLRFDLGTWFEDHGFFHRVAARTDHIFHLPEALYLQTRGRAGQITARDDERVFEQFAVLAQMRDFLDASPRPGGRRALADLASRLLFERSTVIADLDRRARFAQAAHEFLRANDLDYRADPDSNIGESWGMEMAGTLPLSVILSWDGHDPAALEASLSALKTQTAPGHEVLIVCQSIAAQRALVADRPALSAHWKILIAPHTGEGAGFNRGLEHARGTFVIFVATGDVLGPGALLDRTEAMLHARADFGISPMCLHDPATGEVSPHNGIHDMAAWPRGTPPAGPLDMTALQALTLEAQCSAKTFRRSFLHSHGLGFTKGMRSDWALCLAAALLAPCTLYLARQDTTVTLHADGFARWRVPYGMRALNQSHKALLETVSRCLPQDVSAQLPQGWQRRLFARALREQVYFGKYPNRLRRYAMVSAAAWQAWRRRYSTPRAAGLDAATGPRLAQVLDPAGAVVARLLPASALSRAVVQTRRLTGAPETHHAFAPGSGGMVTLRVDFRTDPYANIFFRAADSRQVLFHLSLRHTEALAVCNDQRADGQWRAERICPVALSADTALVTITFMPARVCVLLDGREIFRFGARGLRNRTGFAAVETIAGFTFDGMVATPHILPEMPRGVLSLDSRLNLRVRGTDATDRMHALADGTLLPLTPSPDWAPGEESGGASGWAPDGTATALLPGRLWSGLPAQDALVLELVQGPARHRLQISRADVAARIDALLCLPLAPSDSTLCLNVIEHVRYGALYNLLSPAAQTHLETIAAFYDARSFLQGAQEEDGSDRTPSAAGSTPLAPAAFVTVAEPVDRTGQEIDTALARLAHSQSAPASHRPDPLAVVAALAVSEAAQKPLFLALTAFFCVDEGDVEGLYQLARARGLLPVDMPADQWSLSAALPYLLLDEHYDDVSEALRALAKPGPEWLVTPAIGWTVCAAITRADTPVQARSEIFQGFANLLRARAPDYWDRVHCRELTRAAAALILYRHRLSPAQQTAAVALCLEVYGLSRRFWNDLEAVPDLPDIMIRASAAFRDLANSGTGPAAQDRALRLFEDAGTLEAPRMRREIFGPAGLPRAEASRLADADPIDISDLGFARRLDTVQVSRDMLRHMACPASTPVTPAIAALATAALPALYPETPCAPYLALQQRACAQAAKLLRGEAIDLDMLIDALTQLSDAGSHHIGMGLGLALVDGLHERNPGCAARLCAWLDGQMTRQDRHTWARAPALRQPARRLAQRAGLMPCADALLARLDLPDVPASLPPPEGTPLFDTIVIVFSCAPYLDTRIPALRAGWLSLLEELGLPYLVVVGNGDGTRTGDTVHLDAPDDYEGLPQKTLAAIKWVHDNTSFGHMLKIDDDCFLNAGLFFNALSYRKFDYYGRRLHRVPGQMDRIWHQAKSTSVRGRRDLDKSPEPSEYADGGSAYTLSRTAMAAALEAAASPEGRQLIEVSFMEDKMLGDLLAMRGIHVAQEDYRVSIRRRMHTDAIPVPSWLNSFDPGSTAPLQLVHLDTHLDQQKTLAGLTAPGLFPRKIWPSYQDVRLGYQSNALELVSSEDSVVRARAAEVAVVACMRNEMFMLPHFLAHYRKLGVTAFLIADNCSDDGTLEYLAAQPDVALFTVDTDYKSSRYGVAWQQAMISAFRPGKWSLVADADELLVWQENQRQTLPDLLRGADFADADAVRIFMLDMYPRGPLEDADFSSGDPFAEAGFADCVPFLANTVSRGPYSDQPCWTSALRHRLIPGSRGNLFVAQKLALLRYRPWMRLSAGLHFVGDVEIAPRELLFAHFKYNSDFRRKAQAEVLRGQHFNDAEEYRKYLAIASEGRSVIHDPAISLPWAQVPFIKRRLSV